MLLGHSEWIGAGSNPKGGIVGAFAHNRKFFLSLRLLWVVVKIWR